MSTDSEKSNPGRHGLGKNPFEGMEPFIEAARQETGAPQLDTAEPPAPPKPMPADPIQRAQAKAALHACPFLGLLQDPDIRYLGADEGHRCYAGPRPRSITIPYQERLCLTDHYQDCEIFTQALSRRSESPPHAGPALRLRSWLARLLGKGSE